MRIERREYQSKLEALCGKQIIKVITGVRRCGKSTLLEIMQDKLLESGVGQEQIIAINLEDYDNKELRNPDLLYAHVKSRLHKTKMTYVFLDEIQHVDRFADVIDALYIKQNIDIYITGSNAFLLSSEIATLLSGRYIEIKMLPLSFAEYVESTGNELELSRKYVDYVTNSSFPYTVELNDNPTAIIDYLQGIYSTIVSKDIMQRKNFQNALMLDSVISFIMDNVPLY